MDVAWSRSAFASVCADSVNLLNSSANGPLGASASSQAVRKLSALWRVAPHTEERRESCSAVVASLSAIPFFPGSGSPDAPPRVVDITDVALDTMMTEFVEDYQPDVNGEGEDR